MISPITGTPVSGMTYPSTPPAVNDEAPGASGADSGQGVCTSPRFFVRWAVKRGHREGVGPFDGVVPVPDRMTGYVVLGALLQVPHMYVVMECQQ